MSFDNVLRLASQLAFLRSPIRLGIPLVLTATAISCGGSPDVPSGNDLGDGGRAASGGTQGTAATAGTSIIGNTGGTGGRGGGGCMPKTCEELEINCGAVPDGCGDVLQCGECEEGSICGLTAPNVCSTPKDLQDLCKPLSKKEACRGKECGIEGDGCGGVYECGTCGDGQACGVEEPFKCGDAPTGSEDDCPAKIESCESVGVQCGVIGNGCGGIIDCDAETGGCPSGEACGLGGPNMCGEAPTCEPLDPADACAGKCGLVSNGCGPEVDGGIIDCSELFPCPDGEECGGAGVPNQCGKGDATACEPLTQEEACGDAECGYAGDGCGDAYPCGSCGSGTICVAGKCEAPACTPVPKATACAGKECGTVSDGCGGTYSCGTCTGGEQCGVREAFQCDPPGCVPITKEQACAGKECGVVYDGCGTNLGSCGTCPSGQFCGIKEAFQCDAPTPPSCTPTATSCAAAGWECGTFVNNCGQTFDCAAEGRTCDPLETCVGGINGPTRCEGPGGGSTCTVCDAIPTCSGSEVTRVRGRVITPGRNNTNTGNQVGVPNAFVYILQTTNASDLPPISTGIPSGSNGESCDRCEDQDFGPVLVSTTSDSKGEFELSGNIPVGKPVLLVVKVGKFRRAQLVTVPASAACKTHNLPTAAGSNPARLPRSMSDGTGAHIPRIAVTTGEIDAMECVFEKMGIAHNEFGAGASGTGSPRIHLYRGGPSNNPRGARMSDPTPHDTTLYSDQTRMRGYDMIVADCEGQSWDGSNTSNFTQRNTYGNNVIQYVNRGGRLFASHLSFSWLYENGTQAYASGAARFTTGLGPAANWDTSLYLDTSGTGRVSSGRPRSSPRINDFAAWLVNEGVIPNATGTFTITDPRSSVTQLNDGTEEFVHRTNGNQRTQQFAFNTPLRAPEGQACGRVTYTGFHVAATGGNTQPFANETFPDHCTGNLTAQEKVLLYMLFDLGRCVGDDPEPPSCQKRTCPANACGKLPDGCGGTIDCSCPNGKVCGANNTCTDPGCVPTTCEAEGVICSSISDGCGNVLECPCPVCTPIPKATACKSVSCGTVSDGCSGVHNCGECPPSCQRISECPADVECGLISDGCDGTLDCGKCPSREVCGALAPNRCDKPVCPKLTCEDLNATCGFVGDGCGGSVDCGYCAPGQVCVTVNGEQRCEGCQPLTCKDVGAECGLIGNGCGQAVDCGPCPEGQICGAQEPNRCGNGPSCKPLTCEALDAECGLIGDGCGETIDCGECPPGEVCGLETPYKCAPPPPCEPKTCEDLGAECGLIGDGCNDLLDCGSCPAGMTCGLAEPNRCGQVK